MVELIENFLESNWYFKGIVDIIEFLVWVEWGGLVMGLELLAIVGMLVGVRRLWWVIEEWDDLEIL